MINIAIRKEVTPDLEQIYSVVVTNLTKEKAAEIVLNLVNAEAIEVTDEMREDLEDMAQ